jgi:hypothetical protein
MRALFVHGPILEDDALGTTTAGHGKWVGRSECRWHGEIEHSRITAIDVNNATRRD